MVVLVNKKYVETRGLGNKVPPKMTWYVSKLFEETKRTVGGERFLGLNFFGKCNTPVLIVLVNHELIR